MFIELVDALRCPVPHEESWLVAAASRIEFRHIVEGTLGCPACRAEYPVHRGVVDLRRTQATSSTRDVMPDEGEATRLAAFLGLTDRSGFAVLLGEWGAHASVLRGLVETPLIVVDPADGTEGEPGISVIRCDGAIPLAAGSARGMALDGGSEARIASAVRATRPGGRIVGPASLATPTGATELARDERAWVAEREAASSPLVALHVRRAR
jgi:uncharacterized protein YbaR (Trm112 family)